MGAVGKVADCSTSVSRLDNKLWDILQDKVAVAEPEVEGATLPVEEEASLPAEEEEEEESSNQPADIEQGMEWSEQETLEAFLRLVG